MEDLIKHCIDNLKQIKLNVTKDIKTLNEALSKFSITINEIDTFNNMLDTLIVQMESTRKLEAYDYSILCECGEVIYPTSLDNGKIFNVSYPGKCPECKTLLKEKTPERFRIKEKSISVKDNIDNSDLTIMINPGHGLYKDSDNSFKYQRPEYDGIIEDEITAMVATHLIYLLEGTKVKVVNTREKTLDDKDIGISGRPLWEEDCELYLRNKGIIPKWFTPNPNNTPINRDINSRSHYANIFNNETQPIDLIISIHFNASPKGVSARGCEMWHYSRNTKAKQICENILNETINRTGVSNRGIKETTTSYGIIAHTNPTSIIWEGCFFDNEKDREEFLKDPKYYIKAAEAIYEGILKSKEQGLFA